MVVEVGSGDVHVQRQSAPVTDRMDLGAGLTAVDGTGPGQVPLVTARTHVTVLSGRGEVFGSRTTRSMRLVRRAFPAAPTAAPPWHPARRCSQILETFGVLRAVGHQGRGYWRQYGGICAFLVRGVGPGAQDVVAAPGMREWGPSVGRGARWVETVRGEAGRPRCGTRFRRVTEDPTAPPRRASPAPHHTGPHRHTAPHRASPAPRHATPHRAATPRHATPRQPRTAPGQPRTRPRLAGPGEDRDGRSRSHIDENPMLDRSSPCPGR
jgi:hypothetical protein